MKSKQIKLGIFVTIGLIIFAVTLYYLGSAENLFGSRIEVSAVFKNVSGLQEGSNIRLAGVKVGTVEGIEINTDSTVTITMLIDSDAAGFIKKDAKVSIGTEGLMGNKSINISEGSIQAGQVQEGDELVAKDQADFDNIMSSVLKNSKNLEDITGDLVGITDKVTQGQGVVGTLLYDSIFKIKMESILNSLETTTNNTEVFSNKMKEFSTEIEEGKGVAGKLLTDEQTSKDFQSMMDSIKVVTQEASKIANQLSEFSTMLNNKNGTLGRLLSDTTMAQNIDTTIYNVKERTEELEETIQVVNNSWLLNLFSGNKKKKKEKKKEQAEGNELVSGGEVSR